MNQTKKKSYEMDLCNGPIFKQMILFALPIMFNTLLLLSFNAFDTFVISKFANTEALAAVGSTTSLTGLIIVMFNGCSTGTNIVCGRYFGAKNNNKISQVVHTAVSTAALFGIFLAFFGLFASKPLLMLMNSPEDVIDLATVYMQLYFAGMPFTMVATFCNSLLHSKGDTRRPFYYGVAVGCLKLVLNLLFVAVFHWDVVGVATATLIAQLLSAILRVRALMKEEGAFRLEVKKLKIHKSEFLDMVKFGVPAGLQAGFFRFSGVVMQSAINSFGSAAIAACTVATTLEGYVESPMNLFCGTATNFITQNLGAGKIDRIKRTVRLCLLTVLCIGTVGGAVLFIFAEPLCALFNSESEVISYAVTRLAICGAPIVVVGFLDTMVGVLRGLGSPILPTASTLIGSCGIQVVWIYTVFRFFPTFEVLMLAIPISWAITVLCLFVSYAIMIKKTERICARRQT